MMTNGEINPDHFRVTLFGSARLKPDHPVYKQIHKLAKMIANHGMDIVTGGGPGLMDAASRGHLEGRKNNNVHSIGLAIHLPHEQVDSYHLDIKKEFDKFSGRLDNFMNLSDAVVVAPGGIGTILELFYTWQLIQVQMVRHIPVILLGEMWHGLIDWIKANSLKNALMNQEDLDFVFIVDTPEQAMEILEEAYEEYQKGGKDICSNITKYKVN